ncbi:hypothetical protein AURDEDRAFT_59551 [Auricularia subglabra TFB-10046 SS5]|nr:hypothetical protein AURDEDRAFT_59551 [Auricularia subglabra TFB-10046 SS5]
MSQQDGGVALFDVETRNESQYLVWLKKYLCDSDRPLWAALADVIFRAAITQDDARRLPEWQRLNPFEQNWHPNEAKLPHILKTMWRVSKKHGLALDDVRIPMQARLEASIWAHPAMERKALDKVPRRIKSCLKRKHAIMTVDDLDELALDDDPDHENVDWCMCANCWKDREEGCKHPHLCQEAARDILSEVPEKWNLGSGDEREPGTLEEALGPPNIESLLDEDTCVFPRQVGKQQSIDQLYRVMGNRIAIKPMKAKEIMSRQLVLEPQALKPPTSIKACICSAMARENDDNAQGGICVWFPDGDHNAIFHTFGEGRPNFDSTALLGFHLAAELLPSEDTLHIVSTSRLACSVMTARLQHHEDSGWVLAPDIAAAGRYAAAAIRQRIGETTFTYVCKKRLNAWPEVKDAVAAAVGLSIGDEGDIGDTNEGLESGDKPGLALKILTQGVAHKAIRSWKSQIQPTRRATEESLEKIKQDIADLGGKAPTTRQIWQDLKSRALTRQCRLFLWKAIHGAHKTGRYFAKMKLPWSDYADCPSCGVLESLEHILLECTHSGQERIWDLVAEIFKQKALTVEMKYGLILGCASTRLASRWSERLPIEERFFTIGLASESAFLIWKIRCEARMEHGDDGDWRLDDEAVTQRWQAQIRARKLRDFAMADGKRYGTRGVPEYTAQRTWEDPSDYRNGISRRFTSPGVLVGTGTPSQASGVG